jgi:ethanolamine utilization protein EutJ
MNTLNPDLARLLDAADTAIAEPRRAAGGPVGLGVDLGTACIVLLAVAEDGTPVAGACRFASVVRDGVVVDFAGASAIVRELKEQLERHLGRTLETAATTYPPGVPLTEVRAARYVLESAGITCTAMVDEPTAANAVLQVQDGAVVDVGGGTTGIAIVQGGEIIRTADEPTGGTHLTLVLAGAHRISFEKAEQMKLDPARQAALFPIVRPVLERVGTIIAGHLNGRAVERIYLVGGTSAFPGIAEVVEEVTGVPTVVPGNPLFVTPLGVALHDRPTADVVEGGITP